MWNTTEGRRTIVLLIAILLAIFLVGLFQPTDAAEVRTLEERVNALEAQVSGLTEEVNANRIALQANFVGDCAVLEPIMREALGVTPVEYEDCVNYRFELMLARIEEANQPELPLLGAEPTPFAG